MPGMMSKAEHFLCDRPELSTLGKVHMHDCHRGDPVQVSLWGMSRRGLGTHTQTRSHRHSHRCTCVAWDTT